MTNEIAELRRIGLSIWKINHNYQNVYLDSSFHYLSCLHEVE